MPTFEELQRNRQQIQQSPLAAPGYQIALPSTFGTAPASQTSRVPGSPIAQPPTSNIPTGSFSGAGLDPNIQLPPTATTMSSVLQDPGFQWKQKQIGQSLEDMFAAKGRVGSTDYFNRLGNAQQQLISDEYNRVNEQQYQRGMEQSRFGLDLNRMLYDRRYAEDVLNYGRSRSEEETGYNRQADLEKLQYDRRFQENATNYEREFRENERQYGRQKAEEILAYERSFREDARDYDRVRYLTEMGMGAAGDSGALGAGQSLAGLIRGLGGSLGELQVQGGSATGDLYGSLVNSLLGALALGGRFQ